MGLALVVIEIQTETLPYLFTILTGREIVVNSLRIISQKIHVEQKTVKKIYALLAFAFFFGTVATAQKYLNNPVLSQRPAEKKVTFWDIQKAFQKEWEDKTPSKIESENSEEGGYQQFKRWEWFVEQRTFPSGNFPSPEILFTEYQQYKTSAMRTSGNQTASANWSFLGPHVIPGNGGGAGRINCITFDPTNSNTIWIGAACGGLWKSTDGGLTWSSNTDLLPSLSISEIVIDPTNSQIMYLATGDKYGIYYQYETWGHYSAGVLKSTDGGVTWNPTGLNYSLANVTIIERLIMDPSNTSVLMAATNVGILKSTDAGATWNNIRTGKYYDLEFNPSNSQTVYAGDSIGFLLSTNQGTSWNYVPTISTTGRTSISVTAANSSVVYVWSEGGNLFYSNNSGASFSTRSDPVSIAGPYGYYDYVLEVSPTNENVLFAGGLNIAKSTDGGNTWAASSDWAGWPNSNYVHADNHAQKFLPGSGTVIFSCNDGGIFKSSDQGVTWSDLSGGIDIKQYYRLGGSYLTPNLIYAGAQDNGTDQMTATNSATQVNGADGEEALVDYTDDNIVFVSSQGGYFLKSINGGVTFNALSDFGCDWTSPLIMDPTNHDVMWMGSNDALKSIDNGNTWTNTSNGAFDGGCLYSLEVCAGSPNYVYAATFGHIYRTTNGGTTWNNITATLPVGSAAITGITISDQNPNLAWVNFSGFSAGNKVYKTTDGGLTWTNYSGTLPNIPANCIEYQNGSNDLLYLGTDFGVFYRDATMSDWAPYNVGLPNVIVDELEINYPTSKLRAATYGRGIWESDLQVSTLNNIDASAFSMTSPPSTTCDTIIIPIVKIRNAGQDTLFSTDLHYKMDNQAWQIYNWVGVLPTLATYSITLPTYTLAAGVHTFTAYTANPNSSVDQNANNDTIVRSFTILSSNPGSITPPLVEGFVSSTFPPTNWTLENSSNLWLHNTTYGGYQNSTNSAMADFYNVNGGTDLMFSQYIDFTNLIPPITMYFDLAYAPYPNYYDSLGIELYSDCAGTPEFLWGKGSPGLATAPPMTGSFAPAANQWRTDTLHLDSLAGHSPKEIRFVAISGFGNELYIDNINITANALSVQSFENNSYFSVYPNPANNSFSIEMSSAENAAIKIMIYDLMGNVVRTEDKNASAGKNYFPIDVSNFSDGIYLVQVIGNGVARTKKISVMK
jgi:photosystem II stability/assembly factor-like uncharacterized protein